VGFGKGIPRTFWTKVHQNRQYELMLQTGETDITGIQFKSRPMLLVTLTIQKGKDFSFVSGRLGVFLVTPKDNGDRRGSRVCLLTRTQATELDELSTALGQVLRAAVAMPRLDATSVRFDYLGPNCCRIGDEVRRTEHPCVARQELAVRSAPRANIVFALSFPFMTKVLRSYDSRLRQTQRRPDVYLASQRVGKARIVCTFKDKSASDRSEDNVQRCDDNAWLWEERGCLLILATKYHRGLHWTDSFSDCVAVVQRLKALHVAGYVHGDIRAFNIVFGANELIDYDFGGKVNPVDGTPKYPHGYKPDLPDGSRWGKEGRSITMYDDWYALRMVLTHFHEIEPIAPEAQAVEFKRKIAELKEECGRGLSVEELTKEGGIVEGVASAAVNLLQSAEASECRIAPEARFLAYLQDIGFYYPQKEGNAEENVRENVVVGAKVRDTTQVPSSTPPPPSSVQSKDDSMLSHPLLTDRVSLDTRGRTARTRNEPHSISKVDSR
jgi:hypothetical protein